MHLGYALCMAKSLAVMVGMAALYLTSLLAVSSKPSEIFTKETKLSQSMEFPWPKSRMMKSNLLLEPFGKTEWSCRPEVIPPETTLESRWTITLITDPDWIPIKAEEAASAPPVEPAVGTLSNSAPSMSGVSTKNHGQDRGRARSHLARLSKMTVHSWTGKATERLWHRQRPPVRL